jgi:hypothetical protein
MISVLLLGLDPHTVPGVDAALVDQAIAMGQARFDAAGIAADACLVAPDAAARDRITTALAAKPYACVVIGGGLRKPDDMVELFEAAIALVRVHAPQAAIAFNTNPVTSYDAVKRVLPSAG